jgi:sugar phosphate permease
VGAGVAAAGQLGSSSLLDTVRSAFVHGMDLMLWTCGGIAVGCALLAVIFLRSRPASAGAPDASGSEASSLSVM